VGWQGAKPDYIPGNICKKPVPRDLPIPAFHREIKMRYQDPGPEKRFRKSGRLPGGLPGEMLFRGRDLHPPR